MSSKALEPVCFLVRSGAGDRVRGGIRIHPSYVHTLQGCTDSDGVCSRVALYQLLELGRAFQLSEPQLPPLYNKAIGCYLLELLVEGSEAQLVAMHLAPTSATGMREGRCVWHSCNYSPGEKV